MTIERGIKMKTIQTVLREADRDSQWLEPHFDAIREIIAQLEQQRDAAVNQMREWNKDAEIQNREETITELRKQGTDGFCPSTEQWKQIREWEKRHSDNRHNTSENNQPQKMIPGAAHFIYSFSHTPIGTIGSVECEVCRNTAFERSGGNYLYYQRLCKELDVDFFIGEV